MHWTWIVTAASIIGTTANVYKRRWCFGVWVVTNAVWCAYDMSIRQYSQAMLFGVYLGLAVWGLWKWKAEGRP
ncbi:MAG TPA: hypothetical protein VMX94_04565 [Armatimonadota bacterium]|nr:hypothetical protein [Armatimonadota bacterium]